MPNQDGAETPAYVYSHYFLGRRATALARIDLLNKLSQNFDVTVYTHADCKDILPTASQQPPVQLVVADLNQRSVVKYLLLSIYNML